MTKVLPMLAVAAALMLGGQAAQAKGCIKGAVVGGVAGHFAGHHTVLGAIAGCAIGRHEAKKHAREQRERESKHGDRDKK